MFSKCYNFCKKLLGRSGAFAHRVRVYTGHLWWVINPKVQNVLDWKFVFCTLILRSITGKNFRKIWDGGFHGLDDLTWNYPAISWNVHNTNDTMSLEIHFVSEKSLYYCWKKLSNHCASCSPIPTRNSCL